MIQKNRATNLIDESAGNTNMNKKRFESEYRDSDFVFQTIRGVCGTIVECAICAMIISSVTFNALASIYGDSFGLLSVKVDYELESLSVDQGFGIKDANIYNTYCVSYVDSFDFDTKAIESPLVIRTYGNLDEGSDIDVGAVVAEKSGKAQIVGTTDECINTAMQYNAGAKLINTLIAWFMVLEVITIIAYTYTRGAVRFKINRVQEMKDLLPGGSYLMYKIF